VKSEASVNWCFAL